MKRQRANIRKPAPKAASAKVEGKPVVYARNAVAAAPLEVREMAPAPTYYTPPEAMVRTQIYLTRAEHDFLMGEGNRRNLPMAAIIREYIDEKMEIPEDAWVNNPLLQPAVNDPGFVGREDGAINHDHYISGTPKRFQKVRGKWVPVAAAVS